jgi:hypothetical protein
LRQGEEQRAGNPCRNHKTKTLHTVKSIQLKEYN